MAEEEEFKLYEYKQGDFYSIFFTDWFRWCMFIFYLIMFADGVFEVWIGEIMINWIVVYLDL